MKWHWDNFYLLILDSKLMRNRCDRALETFKGSTIEGKRKLINMVFANLELKDGKLDFKLRPPFDGFVKCTKIEEWRNREDSNLRPSD